MADSSDKLLARLANLNDSLDDLEDQLEPLLSQTLPESLLPLETIQQVKLNVAIPYLVYDLIFIYLKTRGIDPKTHPVVAELDRVRQYFDKIKDAEDPEKRKTAVDKAAANRFIKHAIAQAKDQAPSPGAGSSNTHIRFDTDGNVPAASASSSSPSTPRAPPAPTKVTSKMLARAEWQKQVAADEVRDADMGEADDGDDDADALEVFDEEDDGDDAEDAEPEKVSSKAKGKGRAADGESVGKAAGAKKRRRAAVDPFAGYGDEAGAKPSKPSKKKRSSPQADGEDVPMDDEPASGSATPQSAKKLKSAEKKTKRKAKKAS